MNELFGRQRCVAGALQADELGDVFEILSEDKLFAARHHRHVAHAVCQQFFFSARIVKDVDRDEVVLHRVARQWVLRRGQLVGCVRNVAFEGPGERLGSGTVHPGIERTVRRPDEAAQDGPATAAR